MTLNIRCGVDVRELEKGKATGIGRYLLNFLKIATEEKREWEFILFGNQNTKIDLGAPNLKKIFIPEYLTPWWDQVKLPRYLRKERVDIFLTPYLKAPLFVSCKLVVIINDLIPFLFSGYQGLKSFPRRIYFKNLGRRAAKRADKIITISQYSKKDILKVFRIPEEKIEVIYLSVDRAYHSLTSNLEEITSKYGIAKRFIFCFSNFNPHKNVKTLIEAYYRLPQKMKSEYQLVLGGRRDRYCMSLEKMVKHLKLEEKVIFTGFIPEEDLPLIYNAAELFLFPSLYEGFGLPPLEAMACGTPVIASNTTSLPEVVGQAGILVNPYKVDEIKEAVIRVLTDSTLRNDLIKRGLERAKQFTPEKTAKRILKIFAEVWREE